MDEQNITETVQYRLTQKGCACLAACEAGIEEVEQFEKFWERYQYYLQKVGYPTEIKQSNIKKSRLKSLDFFSYV